jgi:hypothetical protein
VGPRDRPHLTPQRPPPPTAVTHLKSEEPVIPISIQPAARYPLRKGTELLAAPVEVFEQQANLQFTFDVSFGEPQVIKGEPLVPTLSRLLDEVESLLQRLIPMV